MEKNQTNGVVLSETFLLDKKTQGKQSVKGVAFPPKAEKYHEVETWRTTEVKKQGRK